MTTWAARAWHELCRLSDTGEDFTADDLLDNVGHPDQYHEANGANNAVGALFGRGSAEGRIEHVGTAKSRQPHRKGGLVRVWRGKAPEPSLFDEATA